MEVHEGNNDLDTTNENSPPQQRRKGQTQIAFVEDSKKRASCRCKRTQSLREKVGVKLGCVRVFSRCFWTCCTSVISVHGFELATMTGTNVLVIITQSKTGPAEIYVSDRTWVARLGVDVELLQRTCGMLSRFALPPQPGVVASYLHCRYWSCWHLRF